MPRPRWCNVVIPPGPAAMFVPVFVVLFECCTVISLPTCLASNAATAPVRAAAVVAVNAAPSGSRRRAECRCCGADGAGTALDADWSASAATVGGGHGAESELSSSAIPSPSPPFDQAVEAVDRGDRRAVRASMKEATTDAGRA